MAIIDLGTNSVRFDVHSVGSHGSPKLLHREKQMIRLGQDVFLKGRVNAGGFDRAVRAFQEFRRVAEGFGVRKVVAFGTSALREAQNSAEFVERVKDSTGIEVKVISGQEEAKLIAIGVLAHEPSLPRSRFALVDIGGGSTEISICRGRKVSMGDSFALGTARLQQVFLRRSPPRPAALAEMRAYIRNMLGQRMGEEKWPRVSTVVGSSGTIRALARILGRRDEPFSVADLSALVERMASLTRAQLLEIPGLEEKRVDMILAGATLLEEACLALGAKTVVPSDFSLRDGILEEERRLARANKRSLIELHLEDLFSRAERFGADPAHTRHMAAFADAFFERLRPVHGLAPHWKIYFLSTVILRNCGEVVSFADRARHSYYVVRHADFPGMQGWEHEFIARLCLLCGGGKPGNLASLGRERGRKEAFLRLLALVRVVDAFDLGPRTALRLKRVQITRTRVRLVVDGPSTAGVQELLVDRKRRLFEEEFGRPLEVERGRK